MSEFSIPFRLRLSLILAIGIAFLKMGAWLWLGIYGAIALMWSLLLKVPARSLAQLLGAELIFLSVLALPQGWEKASFLLLRSLISLLIMNSFILTLPPHSFGIALKGLPLPAGLQEIVLLAGQYLEILLSEVNRMKTAAQLRGLSGTGGWLRYVSSATIGALYLRSLDRAERVYAAMTIRGYQGQFPSELKSTPKERIWLTITIVMAAGLTIASYS
ncbi:MAG: energy-coupling factor transporter transmembrane protein EcfT [Oscillatoriales cyanobacterium RU_3_3]|nr:energy-coupling factor transporter transmembrane protein EcfT [Microcoleus sp. SU_5_3]NJL65725.1 energy-coupling factor transporter transmembrane protein EcfT [Microcoleus sp. SM1_3_4]NJM61182.1 energy-coupling factor transporter transmembrane protein EcfT [Oscillatoriales cyanobacterium RU_3_3]NJR23427.1 energy-coupling factor transporter transmembrane protein EcfT [Richelia sp. CSU_2_1]